MILPASVAQLVEQGTENPRIGGSIPSQGIVLKNNKTLSRTTLGILRVVRFYISLYKRLKTSLCNLSLLSYFTDTSIEVTTLKNQKRNCLYGKIISKKQR